MYVCMYKFMCKRLGEGRSVVKRVRSVRGESMYMYMYVCTYIYICVCVCVYMQYIYIHIHIYLSYMYVYMHVCVYIYIYMSMLKADYCGAINVVFTINIYTHIFLGCIIKQAVYTE
jgi:hypothetical protein